MGEVDETPSWLLGCWQLLRTDPALDFVPGVRMEFRPGGRLLYTIEAGGREQVFRLIYRVDGDMVEIDNPSAPHRTSTRIAHGEADVLIFDFSGAQAHFVRRSG